MLYDMATVAAEKSDAKPVASREGVTLVVRGGKPLVGEVTAQGAKNSATKLLVATLLTHERSVLHNVPAIGDVRVVFDMIRALGGAVEDLGGGSYAITTHMPHLIPHRALKLIGGKSRIPILFAAPLLHRLHEAMVPELGGCNIGKRPVDFHTHALQAMGAMVEALPKGMRFLAAQLKGATITLPYPSVGATEQILLAASLAEGVTEIKNAAIEPEVIELIAVLQKMGAIIAVETDRVIRVTGVTSLKGFEHTVMPDRNEVVSWACAAAVTNGRVVVRNARQLDLVSFLNAFRKAGGEFEVRDDGILFFRGSTLISVAIQTEPHPGFMTDWQQPFVVLLTQAQGASIVHETVYEDRFGYTTALNAMGAKIQLYPECLGGETCRFGERGHLHSAVVTGPTPLRGANIIIPDLRAGFSYVIAALAAEGVSTLHHIEVIDRGYELFLEKLRALHANVEEKSAAVDNSLDSAAATQ